MKKYFFTNYNREIKNLFLSKEEADKVISRNDLEKANKKAFYKGEPKYEYESISLYPFTIELDFTLNERYTEKEKKRLSIPRKGKIVSLLGLYSSMTSKGGGKYKSCAVGDFLTFQKVCRKQRGVRGSIGYLYYELSDKNLFKFWEKRGYKKEFLNPNQPDRVSFTKTINNDSEANQNYDDIHEFDEKFTPNKRKK